jgi:hypothetical protein
VIHLLTAILWISFVVGAVAIVAFLLRRPD